MLLQTPHYFVFVLYALKSSEDEEVDYHEGVDEHQRYCVYVSFKLS
jgi:hypothetical protein